MEAILYLPEDPNEITKLNKEIASTCTRTAIALIASLKLSPKQLERLYEELEKETAKNKTA